MSNYSAKCRHTFSWNCHRLSSSSQTQFVRFTSFYSNDFGLSAPNPSHQRPSWIPLAAWRSVDWTWCSEQSTRSISGFRGQGRCCLLFNVFLKKALASRQDIYKTCITCKCLVVACGRRMKAKQGILEFSFGIRVCEGLIWKSMDIQWISKHPRWPTSSYTSRDWSDFTHPLDPSGWTTSQVLATGRSSVDRRSSASQFGQCQVEWTPIGTVDPRNFM